MYAGNMAARMEYRRLQRKRILRQKQKRREFIVLLTFTMALVFALGIGFGTILARAEEKTEDTSCKYYSNIEIKRGDTLWAIADAYMDSVHYETRSDYICEVMTINHLTSDRLIAGQKLIVPYYLDLQQ